MIQVNCSCGQTLQVRDELAGKRAKCPKCDGIFTVPGPSANPPPAPVPPSIKNRPNPTKNKSAIRTPAGAQSGRRGTTGAPAPFDSPDARAERLMVLTNGQEPVELYRMRKATVNRNKTQVVWFADVIVCDVGLLVVPYTHHNPAQAQATGMHFGLIGAAVAAVSNSMAQKSANKRYDDETQETEGWSPTELFVQVTTCPESGGRPSQGPVVALHERLGALFIPADELDKCKFSSKKTLQVKWRGIDFKFTQDPKPEPEHREGWGEAYDGLEEWQDQAAQLLEQRNGGPATPGLPSLIEWGSRPASVNPPWVEGAVQGFMSDSGAAAVSKLFKTVQPDVLGRLVAKLRQLESDAAADLATELEAISAGKSKPYIIVGVIFLVLGVVGGIMIAALAALEVMEGDIIILPVIVVAVLGLISLVCLILGLDIKSKFNNGLKAVAQGK